MGSEMCIRDRYACHEGNYGMVNTLRGARVEERLVSEGIDIGERD